MQPSPSSDPTDLSPENQEDSLPKADTELIDIPNSITLWEVSPRPEHTADVSFSTRAHFLQNTKYTVGAVNTRAVRTNNFLFLQFLLLFFTPLPSALITEHIFLFCSRKKLKISASRLNSEKMRPGKNVYAYFFLIQFESATRTYLMCSCVPIFTVLAYPCFLHSIFLALSSRACGTIRNGAVQAECNLLNVSSSFGFSRSSIFSPPWLGP